MSLFLLIPFLALSQRAEVKIKFNEKVCVQDIEKPLRYGLYEAVMCDTKGTLTFYVFCDDNDNGSGPMHLIIHTEDNEYYNLIIIPTCHTIPTQMYEWSRGDLVVDLTNIK